MLSYPEQREAPVIQSSVHDAGMEGHNGDVGVLLAQSPVQLESEEDLRDLRVAVAPLGTVEIPVKQQFQCGQAVVQVSRNLLPSVNHVTFVIHK